MAPDRGTPRYDGDALAGVALSVNVLYVSMSATDQGSLVSSIAEWLLARLWRDQSRPQQAHDLLAPVYNWFTEGFDTPVLQEAKALLDKLA